MTDESQQEQRQEVDAGLRAWAAVVVRQAQELWPRAQDDPQSAELKLVIEHLATVERQLPPEGAVRAAVVFWLGLLQHVRLKGRSQSDPQAWLAAVNHLRWIDRAGPYDDRLALMAREHLAEMLVPEGTPRELRDASLAPALVATLRRQFQEALDVLARVVAGDLSTRERVLPEMDRVAALMALLPEQEPEEAKADAEKEAGAEADASVTAEGRPGEIQESRGGPEDEEAARRRAGLAAAVRAVAHWAFRDAVRCTRLLRWLCVNVNLPWVSAVEATRELSALDLDQAEFAPLYELLAALRSGDQDSSPALAEHVLLAVRTAGEELHARPEGTPERIRAAKFHAALMVVGNLRAPGALDFADVDAAVLQADPDPAAHAAWGPGLGLELMLSTTIDNLWVADGELARLERSAAWLRETLDGIAPDAPDAETARRHLTELLAHRILTVARLGGSLQDGATALSMAEELTTSDHHDTGTLLSLSTRSQQARRSRDAVAQLRVAEDTIRILSEQYANPAPDAGTRFVVTSTLGLAHGERGALTGDQADLQAAARYLREAVATNPATVPPLFAPDFPTTRAWLLTELALLEPRRDVIDVATTEVHRVIDAHRPHPWVEVRMRIPLGRVMLRATTRRSDLSLLDPCIAELSRARALAAAHLSPLVHAEILTELSTAYWISAVTGTSHESTDWRSSLDTRREALELMAADVLLQLGAEHALSAARSATGHALWLAQRCAEYDRPTEAVEALELGRALVLHTAAATHGVPRQLADRGHADLAEQWRTRPTLHPLQEGPHRTDGNGPGAAPGTDLPSSTRRKALAALGAGNGTGARELLGTPDTAALTAALARAGADALVYLVPGEGFRPHVPGHALVLRPGSTAPTRLTLPLLLSPGSHQLDRYLAAAADRSRKATDPDASRTSRDAARAEWQTALSELCDWAWPAAVGPVLDAFEPLGRAPRIVLVPCGRLGVVPWHAARKHIPLGGHRYACQDAVFSYAPSGAQFLRAATRDRLPGAADQVLLSDPRLSLTWAEIETEAVRSACYPNALRYGEFVTAEGVPDAPGSREDLLAVLPGGGRPASVVHLSCHGVAGPSPTRSAVSLADGELTVADILDHGAAAPGRQGSLVVLSACETDLSTGDHDEALTLSTALVARGAADVIGSRWAVDDGATALMMAVFHHILTTEGLAPADALRTAQVWMLDPDRRPPPGLGDVLHHASARTDLHEIHLWAAFTHQGNPSGRAG